MNKLIVRMIPFLKIETLINCRSKSHMSHETAFWERCINHMKDRMTKGGEQDKWDLPCTGSHPKWPWQPGLDQTKVKKQKFLLDLPCWCRDPSPCDIFCYFPSCITRHFSNEFIWCSERTGYGRPFFSSLNECYLYHQGSLLDLDNSLDVSQRPMC